MHGVKNHENRDFLMRSPTVLLRKQTDYPILFLRQGRHVDNPVRKPILNMRHGTLHLSRIWSPPEGVKREVRCKSGAIPVAVKLALPDAKNRFQLQPLFYHGKREGSETEVKPEDLPDATIIILLSGEKQGV